MVFIDGGYVREAFASAGIEKIDMAGFVGGVRDSFNLPVGWASLGRIYYYDAIVEGSEDSAKYKEQRKFFHSTAILPDFEVKLGRLVKTPKEGFRQKGVDMLICIDMLTKAFDDYYDIALLVAGDDDFVDLVNAVKNFTNKKVFGALFETQYSERLQESLDNSKIFKNAELKRFIMT